MHAICRDFFETIPIAPRVFYKNSSNDVVKSFDMVHARFPKDSGIELWLGESKIYKKSSDAISDANSFVMKHLDQGFLTNEKLLIGPQISKSVPHYEEIIELFKSQTSLDKLLNSAVFVIGIASNSNALAISKELNDVYKGEIAVELNNLADKLSSSSIPKTIRLLLIYVPLLRQGTVRGRVRPKTQRNSGMITQQGWEELQALSGGDLKSRVFSFIREISGQMQERDR